MSWVEIKAANEARAALVAKMQGIVKLAETEKRELTPAEEAEFTAHETAAAAHGKTVERLSRIEALDSAVRACHRPGGDAITGTASGNPVVSDGDKIGGFDVKELRKYSLMRAIRCRMEQREVDGFEGEVSKELALRSGKNPTSFFYPTEIPTGRDLELRTTVNQTTGTGAIATILDPSNWIDLLRTKVVVASMGARFLTGLTGYLNLPKTTQASTAYWTADGTAPTASNQVIGTVAFSPNTLGAYVDYTRKFLLQSSTSAEAFVRDDLNKVMAIELDRAALNGSGSSNQPTGVLQQASLGITSVGTNGGAMTFALAVAMETAVAAANADGATCGYVTNAKVRGQLKTTLRSSVAGATYTWDQDSPSPQGGLQRGIVNGYRAMASQNMPSNLTKASGSGLSAMVFADWSQLIVAQWGQLDILVDPFTGSNTGMTRIVALSDIDVQVRHIEAFNAVVDIQA